MSDCLRFIFSNMWDVFRQFLFYLFGHSLRDIEKFSYQVGEAICLDEPMSGTARLIRLDKTTYARVNFWIKDHYGADTDQIIFKAIEKLGASRPLYVHSRPTWESEGYVLWYKVKVHK